jgi:hypothetical protein
MGSNSSILNKRHIIAEIIQDAYVKSYKMRAVGAGSSLEATIPRAIVEREARRHNLSVEEFIKAFHVEYLFNDFGGAFVRFRKVAEQSDVKK